MLRTPLWMSIWTAPIANRLVLQALLQVPMSDPPCIIIIIIIIIIILSSRPSP